MFPLSINGRVIIANDTSPQTVVDEISSTLLVKGISVDYRPDGGIYFRLGLFHNLGWTYLLGISSGRVCCQEHQEKLQINYKLSFLHLTIQVSALLVICKWLEVTLCPIGIPVKYYLLVWIWLVCGNILITMHEFKRFLRDCAAESCNRIFYWLNQEINPRIKEQAE